MIRFAPHHIVRRLLYVLLILLLGHAVALICRHGFGFPFAKGLVPLFDMDHEGSLFTLFSVLLLFLCAALSHTLGRLYQRRKSRYAWSWFIFGALFTLLGLDEGLGLHERLGKLHEFFGGLLSLDRRGILLTLAALGLPLLLASLQVLRSLQQALFPLCLLAGCLYVGGALGLDLAGELWFAGGNGEISLARALLATLEEGFEVSGTLLFLYVLTRQLEYLLTDRPIEIIAAEPEPNRPAAPNSVSSPLPSARLASTSPSPRQTSDSAWPDSARVPSGRAPQ